MNVLLIRYMFTEVIGKVKKCNFLMDYYKTSISTTGLFLQSEELPSGCCLKECRIKSVLCWRHFIPKSSIPLLCTD